MTEPSTKTRIMDAAEKLFAERGFDGASMRAICTAANANSASVHYYFESKEDLASATIGRRMAGLADRRKEMLDELAPKGESPSARAIIRTLVMPLAELIESEGDSGRAYVRMLACITDERPDIMRAAFYKYNIENLHRQYGAMAMALPHIAPDTLRERLAIASTVFLHWLARPFRFETDGPNTSSEPGESGSVSQLVNFLAGGMAA